MLIGASSLWHHGWTTQICRREERAGALHAPQVGIYYRTPERMVILAAHAEGGCVVPEMALADALYPEGQGLGGWIPQLDDLDGDLVSQGRDAILGALVLLGCTGEQAVSILEAWAQNPQPTLV